MTLPPSEVQVGWLYRNTKRGAIYRVVLLATHSETDDVMVVYTSLDTGRHFARPLDLFTGLRIDSDGTLTPRFVLEAEDGGQG